LECIACPLEVSKSKDTVSLMWKEDDLVLESHGIQHIYIDLVMNIVMMIALSRWKTSLLLMVEPRYIVRVEKENLFEV